MGGSRPKYPTLLTAVAAAADAGLAATTWQLAWMLTSFQLRQGYWDDHERAQRAAWTPRGARVTRRARHTRCLPSPSVTQAGREDDAEPLYTESLRLLEGLGGYPASRAGSFMGGSGGCRSAGNG